ncbi:GNAT family N-acetyltransferase [Mycoplasmatota bacterium WC44]
MDNDRIIKIAIEQSAKDYGLDYNDFITNTYSIHNAKPVSKYARNYLVNEPYCNFVYYGKSLVAVVNNEIKEFIESFIKSNENEVYRVFDAPQITILNNELEKYNKCIAHLAQFYIPDVTYKPILNKNIETKLYVGNEINELYVDKRFKMALNYTTTEKRHDEIALVAIIDDKIVGVAGASNDCKTMWQIGIDVLEEYRNQGIASTLTYLLSREILNKGIVPFYCCAWSNLASKNTARKAGFKDAWVELTAKDISEEWIEKIREVKA